MSAVYTELQRLESLGLVEHELEAETPTRSRRVYAITPTGSELLAGWVGSPEAERTVVKSPTLLRVLFGAVAEPAALAAAVGARIAQAAAEVVELERAPEPAERHHAIVKAAAVRLRRAEIDELRRVLDEL